MTETGGKPAPETRAIVVVSIGWRPWLEAVLSTLRPYAEVCGADLIVERKLPAEALVAVRAMPDSPGRPNKAAYACKTYYAWVALTSGYDRVLVLDDTCCVAPTAPSVFAAVPKGCFGYTVTAAAHADDSFASIERFVARHRLPPVEFDHKLYMNSGVLLYDRAQAGHLRPEAIEAAADLLFAQMPHQTLSYYLSRRGAFDAFRMPKAFNKMPAMELRWEERRELKDARPYLGDDVHIYHVTGLYRHRAALIRQIAEALMAGR